jgi:DNA topoisomerase IA
MESNLDLLIKGRFKMSNQKLTRGGFARIYDTFDTETQKQMITKVNKKEKVHDRELQVIMQTSEE